ncbi:MAG: hypothetical protein ACRDTT_10755 [Pseudonocardiaceae bacterium]
MAAHGTADHATALPVNDTAPRRTWRDARRIERFNGETGAMDASVEDLVELRTQLERALHAD